MKRIRRGARQVDADRVCETKQQSISFSIDVCEEEGRRKEDFVFVLTTATSI